MKKTILIIISDKYIREAFFQFLSSENYSCMTAENINQAIEHISKISYDVLICDFDLYKSDRSKFIKKTCKQNPFIVYIVHYIDRSIVKKLQETENVDYIISPIDFNLLLNKLNSYFSPHQTL